MADKTLTFGLPFFIGSREEVRKKIIALALCGTGGSVIFANAHVVVEASQNIPIKKTLLNADLIVADGVPITWVMKARGAKIADRYSGPDLMEDIFELTKDKKHFFLGSSPEVLKSIEKKFKGLAAGFYSPPFATEFDEVETAKQLQLIEDSKPDFIWVGLGAPKQEKYVIKMAKLYSKAPWLAVGAAFDFYSGTKSRAPKKLQSLGLEWAYRMATEPKRLATRYFKTNPIFIKLALQEIARSK